MSDVSQREMAFAHWAALHGAAEALDQAAAELYEEGQRECAAVLWDKARSMRKELEEKLQGKRAPERKRGRR